MIEKKGSLGAGSCLADDFWGFAVDLQNFMEDFSKFHGRFLRPSQTGSQDTSGFFPTWIQTLQIDSFLMALCFKFENWTAYKYNIIIRYFTNFLFLVNQILKH